MKVYYLSTDNGGWAENAPDRKVSPIFSSREKSRSLC